MPEPDSDRVRIVPLGGLGQIGMNCMAIEQSDGILVVDCGAGFPEDDLGVDVLHPDFSWLLDQRERVSGIFLTHGHEDHVGALPYLLGELDVPVFGPPHALGVARRRLDDHGFGQNELDLRDAHAGQVYRLGPFEVEPIRVTHSIVEASALCIRTRAGTIVHSGDFNLDDDPPDGEPTDEARLTALGDEGVSLLLSDSTNIDVEVRQGSERGVGLAVEQLVAQARGRVVIAMFASNVQRLILFGEMARRVGRKICLLGRSLDSHVEIARQIRRLSWPSDLLVSADEAQSMPRDRLLVLAGGTQAERNSAMRRLASGIHPALKLEEGDSVIMSSRAIPGNERGVFHMMNDLLRLGVHVHSRVTDPGIHTSGHAARAEQRRMIELCRPSAFLPVHGSLHHLLRHAELARDVGVSSTAVVENGTTAALRAGRVAPDDTVPYGIVHVAMGGEEIEPEVLHTRAELGRAGIVVGVLTVDRGQLAGPPTLSVRGVPHVDGDDGAQRILAKELARAYETYRPGRGLELEEWARRTVRRKVEDLSGTRPTIEIKVVEV